MDVLSDEPIHVTRPDDLSDLEVWTIDGEMGVTLPSNRARYLRDSRTDEAIGPKDSLYLVRWLDVDFMEHEALLTFGNVAALQRKVEPDEFGLSVVHDVSVHEYAEPGSRLDFLKVASRAYRR